MADAQNNKLYVGNLDYGIDSEKLGEIFAEYGEVEEAVVISYADTGRSKGFGFVTYADAESATKAKEALDGKEVEGREIKVDIARPKEEE
jgi:RNA recognition motif-containing protein